MTEQAEIIDLIPLLVQGRFSKDDSEKLLAEINKLPELKKELIFWQGVHSVRASMSRFDSSDHPHPETLHRLASGEIRELSADHSELSSHLQQCSSCRQDLDLLRQSLEIAPEEDSHLKMHRKESSLRRALTWFFSPKVVYAPYLSLLAIAIVAILFLKPWQTKDTVPIINLTPEFERRSIIDDSRRHEYEVSLSKETEKLIIAFVTDRLEIPDYSYSVDLNSEIGDSVDLSALPTDCQLTKLTNRCQMEVTDVSVLNLLKRGGSFTLTVKELFPEDVDLQPAEYEYYFKVTLRD